MPALTDLAAGHFHLLPFGFRRRISPRASLAMLPVPVRWPLWCRASSDARSVARPPVDMEEGRALGQTVHV
ncbi:hypothetical protein ACP70R_010365 [Stipagrostis hirtigluma subsp. patula]